MDNNDKRVNVIVSDYLDRGWVDLDTILDEISLKTTEDTQRRIAPHQEPTQTDQQEKLRIKVVTLMNILDVNTQSQDKLISKCTADNDWEVLLQRLLERTSEKFGLSHKTIRLKNTSMKWLDLAVYRNGVQARVKLYHTESTM